MREMIIVAMNVLCNYSMNVLHNYSMNLGMLMVASLRIISSLLTFPIQFAVVCLQFEYVPCNIFLLFKYMRNYVKIALICCDKHFTFSLIAFCLISLHGPSPLAGQGYGWS